MDIHSEKKGLETHLASALSERGGNGDIGSSNDGSKSLGNLGNDGMRGISLHCHG